MFTFTNKEIGQRVTNEKCFNDLYDLYDLYECEKFKKLVLVLENRIAYELSLKMISVKWAIACAERSLHFFEEKRPNDNRPRKAIEAAQQWIIDPTAYNAAYIAADANAANDAAYIASCAAYAASYADIDVSVTYYYASAAQAAYTAAQAAYTAAAYANAAEQKWSRNKLKEIVGEYINDYKSDLKNTLNIIPELSDIIINYVV